MAKRTKDGDSTADPSVGSSGDLEDLARRYLDSWEERLAAMAAEADPEEAMRRSTELLGAVSASWAGLADAWTGAFGAPPGPPAAAPASGDSGRDLADLADRIAALERRLDALERRRGAVDSKRDNPKGRERKRSPRKGPAKG